MHHEIVEVNPVDYFKETKIDESILLDLRLSSEAVYMIVDYAGASFDWSESVACRSGSMSAELPNREFRLLLFERVKNTRLVIDECTTTSDLSDFSILGKPGVSVVYSAIFRKLTVGYYFETMSNKFDLLAFEFESLKSSELIASPVLIGNDWAYFSVPQGDQVDICNPFFC